MILFLYNLFWPIGLLVFLPGYLVKMFRRGGYRKNFGQRFAFFDGGVRSRLTNENVTWLHAVSVGEVSIALKLARQLRLLEPDLRCVLTVTTTTGFALAANKAPPWMEVMYSPLDFWPIAHRAFSVVRPRRLILVEAEVWPNLVTIARRHRVPVMLINARLSPRSDRRFQRFKRFVSPLFRQLDLICVPEREDIARWQSLGVDPDRIHYVGSVKYDPDEVVRNSSDPAGILRRLGVADSAPVVLGGSTHRGEEVALGGMLQRLRAEFPNLFLIVAPRHAERAREIEEELQQLGLGVALRSRADESTPRPDCLILDSTGELRYWYPLATVVFIGKSLFAHGGQNPAEPIVAQKPVVFGPNMQNFAVLAQKLVTEKGALQVHSVEELQTAIAVLLRDSNARYELAQQGANLLQVHHGAAARTARLIHEITSSSLWL